MSLWTDQWRNFVEKSSYRHLLKEKGISNDQFWRDYRVYDEISSYMGYPGEILERVSSLISPGSTVLDIGAGTGAFAIPLAQKAGRVIALDPSSYQLGILKEKAAARGLENIVLVNQEWARANIDDDVDYSLSAYSLFDEEIEHFLRKMLDISKRGVFIVFRAGEMDPLSDFAYGPRPSADYLCLQNILDEMGHQFQAEIFSRDYWIPLRYVFQQFRFSEKSKEELADFLKENGQLARREEGPWAYFSSQDALLYRLS
jgi:ubiquinone/menaquinone biosynthesis C-methylase UbiE